MKLFLLLTIAFASPFGYAEVKPVMQEFYNLTGKIRPFLIDKNAFMDPKNEAQIQQALTDFATNTKGLKNEKMAKTPDMKFRAQLLSEGLDEAEKAFRDGFKDYSFWAMKASLNNCFSCHTQKSLAGTNYEFDEKESKDLYSKAEFLFIVRNYEKANPLFVEILTGYPKNGVSVENLESSAQKLLFYAVRASGDDSEIIRTFDKILKNTKLPSSLTNDIIAWKKYLNLRKFRINSDLKITTPSELKEFMRGRTEIASRYKSPSQRSVVDLDTTRFLYRLLEDNTDLVLRPNILYWLASIETDYRISMFDSSAENYLRECIEKFPKNPVAKKCYDLYREVQISSFTGSRGTDLPKSVSEQLKKYEEMIKK